MQMEVVEKKDLDIRVYYKNLTKKDKGRFISFLVKRFDVNYSTIVAKLNARSKMKQLETEAITKVINEGLWKI